MEHHDVLSNEKLARSCPQVDADVVLLQDVASAVDLMSEREEVLGKSVGVAFGGGLPTDENSEVGLTVGA